MEVADGSQRGVFFVGHSTYLHMKTSTCIYAYINIYTCTYMHVREPESSQCSVVFMRHSTHLHMYTSIYRCLSDGYIDTCTHIQVRVPEGSQRGVCFVLHSTHLYVYTSIYKHVCMCTYVHTCTHIYRWGYQRSPSMASSSWDTTNIRTSVHLYSNTYAYKLAHICIGEGSSGLTAWRLLCGTQCWGAYSPSCSGKTF